MKRLILFAVAIVIFGGNLFSTPFTLEDESYITIFDDATFLGDKNFNLIRLYKAEVKPRFRKNLPTCFSYVDEVETSLRDLRCSEGIKLLSLGYKKLVADQNSKEYFYKTFSSEVDKYVFERLAIASTDRDPDTCNTWSVPGEIIYFDAETKEPCAVDVGAFQYVIDVDGACFSRSFVLYGRSYLVVGKGEAVRRCWKTYGHLDHTAVSDQIGRFLDEQKSVRCGFFSKDWCKEVLCSVNNYNRAMEIDFL